MHHRQIAWPSAIFAWSRSSKRSPAVSARRLSLWPSAASAAISRPCASKAWQCSPLWNRLCSAIRFHLLSSPPGWLRNFIEIYRQLPEKIRGNWLIEFFSLVTQQARNDDFALIFEEGMRQIIQQV